MDIQAFVQHQERDRKPFLVNDPEVDGLVSGWKILGETIFLVSPASSYWPLLV
jgi:hypothetical protein